MVVAQAAYDQALADGLAIAAAALARDQAVAAAQLAADKAGLTDADALAQASDAAAIAALQAQALADATDAQALAHAADLAATQAAQQQAIADLTDAGQLKLLSDAAAHSPLTVEGFHAGLAAAGGDMIDLSAIAHLTASAAVGVNLGTDFGNDNLFIFDGTAVSIRDAANAIAADDSVLSGQGYIVIRDADHGGAVTVYHSSDLSSAQSIDTALVMLSGVNILHLLPSNFQV